MVKRFFLLLVLINIQLAAFSQDTISVLFIGNSFTAVNTLPSMFKYMSDSAGKTYFIDQVAPGGYTLEQHSANPQTIQKIYSRNWTYVVLQEQSQIPSFDPERDTMMFPYAVALDSMIHDNFACTKTIFFLTWAHKNGDLGIIGAGGTDSYIAMQQRLRDGYTEIADSLKAIISPVGLVWKKIREDFPAFELYAADDYHPSVYGSYIACCVFYSTIYKESCVGNSYSGSVADSDVANIQLYSSNYVIDSLEQWNNGLFAHFSWLIDSDSVTFTNYSVGENMYSWDFGDGTFSEEENPVHEYQLAGNYTVTLTVTDSCIAASRETSQELLIEENRIDVTENDIITVFPNPFSNSLTIANLSSDSNIEIIEPFSGKTVLHQKNYSNELILNTSDISSGIYILKISDKNNTFYRKISKIF